MQRPQGVILARTWKQSGNTVFTFCSIVMFLIHIKILLTRDFPGGTMVKNPIANAGDTGSHPGPG